LFVEESNLVLASNDKHTNLYVASYISGPWSPWSGSTTATVGFTEGNIVLVNPTISSFSNLTLAIQVDNSDVINPSLGLWNSDYELNSPNTFFQSEELWRDMQNFSTPITSINIGSNQKENISLSISSSISFPFSSHSLKIYVSQNNFGDIINGQLLIVPQTEAYLQIVNFSAVESDEGTYHQYFNSTLNSNIVTVAFNPNFYQRYHNISKYDIYADNFGIMYHMGATDYTYRNVTVFNNNTFPVNSVTVFGQKPYQTRALIDYAIQPSEAYLFPVSDDVLPSYAYVTGYVANNSPSAFPTPTSTPAVPEIPLIAILPLFVFVQFVAVLFRHRKTANLTQ
jgi:hypothetical protein